MPWIVVGQDCDTPFALPADVHMTGITLVNVVAWKPQNPSPPVYHPAVFISSSFCLRFSCLGFELKLFNKLFSLKTWSVNNPHLDKTVLCIH